MDADRLRRGRENAAMLIQEHLDAEAAAQAKMDSLQSALDAVRLQRNTARNKARSERTRWAGFALPPLVFAEDAPEVSYLEYVRAMIVEGAEEAPDE